MPMSLTQREQAELVNQKKILHHQLDTLRQQQTKLLETPTQLLLELINSDEYPQLETPSLIAAITRAAFLFSAITIPVGPTHSINRLKNQLACLAIIAARLSQHSSKQLQNIARHIMTLTRAIAIENGLIQQDTTTPKDEVMPTLLSDLTYFLFELSAACTAPIPEDISCYLKQAAISVHRVLPLETIAVELREEAAEEATSSTTP